MGRVFRVLLNNSSVEVFWRRVARAPGGRGSAWAVLRGPAASSVWRVGSAEKVCGGGVHESGTWEVGPGPGSHLVPVGALIRRRLEAMAVLVHTGVDAETRTLLKRCVDDTHVLGLPVRDGPPSDVSHCVCGQPPSPLAERIVGRTVSRVVLVLYGSTVRGRRGIFQL